jgi:hypothetical protein
MTEPTAADNDLAVTSRRRFLREGGALMGGAVLTGLASSEVLAATAEADANNLPPNIPEWMKAPGDPMGSQLYGMPSPFEKGVIKNIPKNCRNTSLRRDGRRCRISTVSSRRTGCSTNATMAAFPPSIRRSTG